MTNNKTVSRIDLNYFNKFSEGYNPYSEADLDLIVGSLVDFIRDRQHLRICEVGSASGQFSQELMHRLQREDAVLFGLDIAVQVLRLYPYHRICGSAFQIPVPDGTFDVACYPASLHHLSPFEDAIAEISRVLTSGGYMYCVEPNFFHPQRRYFMRFQRLYRLYRDANDVPINPYQLEELLQAHGMRPLMLQYVNINFKKPSMIQKVQNLLSKVTVLSPLNRVILPWFILVAVKNGN